MANREVSFRSDTQHITDDQLVSDQLTINANSGHTSARAHDVSIEHYS